MIEIPTSLIDAIRTRKAVLVSGLGPGRLTRRPGWEALTGLLIDWLEDPIFRGEVRALLDTGRRTAAIAALGSKLTDEVVTEIVRDAFSGGSKVPDEVAALAAVPFRGVITTAWDGLWDAALGPSSADPARIFLPREADDLPRHRGRFLLHALGSSAAPETLCVTPSDLRRKIAPTPLALTLRELYRRWSFVFVGFEPGDPDLALLGERLLGGQATDVEHFFLHGGEPGFAADTLAVDLGLTTVHYAGDLGVGLRAIVDAWTAVATEAQPTPDDVEGWLAAWTRDPSDHLPEAALARAEAKLRAEQQWEPVIALLLGRAQRRDDGATKIAEWRAAAQICEAHLNDAGRAFSTLLPAFRLDPDDPSLLAEIARRATQAHSWNDFVVEYTELAVGLGRAPTAARHWAEIGRIYAAELGQVDNAIGSYQRVLTIEPSHAGALWALRDLLTQSQRWSELAPVLTAAAETARDRTDQLALWLQLADLQASRLKDADGALATYERLYQRDSSAPDVLEALEHQYRTRARWNDLGRILERKAVLASDPVEAARIRKQRADMLAEQLGDVEATITTLESALASEPDDRTALRQLETLYEKAGREEDALRTLERLCALADDPAEKVALLRRAAAAWEVRPDGLDRAVAALEQLLQIEPNDQDAFRGLAHGHRRARRWMALADVLKRRIGIAPTASERQEHQATLARLYEQELGDSERALDAYAAAGADGDERESTWEALARLNEQQKRWRSTAEALDRWAQLAKDPATRTQALYRAAMTYGERLDEQTAAQERLTQALVVDDGYLPALTALTTLYRAQGQYLRAAQLMRQTADRTDNRAEKVGLLYEAGTLFDDKVEDAAAATESFSAVLAIDPEHLLSAERLVELHTRSADWAALEPVLDMLARKVDARNAPLAADIQSRLGFAARKLGMLEKAERCYQTAHRLAPDSLLVLAGYAELCIEQQAWKKAAALFTDLVENHREELPQAQLVDVCFHLGRCEAGLGDRRGAISWYQKALAVDIHHRPSIEAMATLHQEASDWVALLLDKRTLMGLVEGDEKVELAEEIGALYAEKLSNPAKAIAAYQSALALAPQRRHSLHKILELFTTTKQWPRAADTLGKLAQVEESPEVRAKYLYAAAVIQRDEMGDRAQALMLLNRALDESPQLVKAFDAIERVTSETDDWKELARNYRRMIKRLPPAGHDEFRLRLWNSLGELALQRLGDRDLAATALEAASTLDPGNAKRHEQLAELYLEAGPDQLDKAIHHHQLLVALNPDRLSTYKTLARLYREAGQLDKQWCVSATLAFLRKADPDVQQFFEQHRPANLRPARRKFTDELWPMIVHRDEDPFVAAVFMLLGHFVAATAAQQHQAVGIRRKDRADVTRDDRLPSKVLRYVAMTLDLPPPDLFFSDSDAPEAQGLSMLNLQERGVLTPAFVIGEAFAERLSEPDLVFEVGKRAAFLRPERFLRSALPSPSALDITLRAALALAGSPIGSGPHNGEVDRLADHLRRLVPRPVAEQLAVVGRKLQAARGDVIDLEAWMGAADLTAARVGFLLSSDLTAAARMISTETASTSPLPPKERLRDLLAYSVSEEYFAARKFLGLELM